MMRRTRWLLAPWLVVVWLLAGCATDSEPDAEDGANSAASASAGSDDDGSDDQEYPDVVEAELQADGEGGYRLDVTMSSPYDSPERYASGWRVIDPAGETLAEHRLGHDHANEQPFTRTQTGLEIPGTIESVTIEGRDLKNGYGGATVQLDVP